MKTELLVLSSVHCLLRLVYVEASPRIHRSAERDCISKNYFKCATTDLCIWHPGICDGKDDCGDNSDELNCGRQRRHTESCTAEEYQCIFSNRCIPKEKFCDGIMNCQFGSDEYEGCEKDKTCTGFKCEDGQCLGTKEQACNGIVDCNDKSDESNCTTSSPPVINSTAAPENCSDGMFPCNNSKCIHPSLRCDGKDDCGDNSDENNPKCSEAMEDSNTQNPDGQHRRVSWTAPMPCNFSSNSSDRSPRLTFNFFFRR